jgi:hypothetical protein
MTDEERDVWMRASQPHLDLKIGRQIEVPAPVYVSLMSWIIGRCQRLRSHAAMISNTATIAAHRPKPATPTKKTVASVIGQDPSMWPRLRTLNRFNGS